LDTLSIANYARSEWRQYVVATEMLNHKRKTNRREAGKLLDQLYDFDVNGHKKALRPIRVPTLQEQKSRRLCRMRSQLIKLRNIMEGQGRGLLFDFDFHEVVGGDRANGPSCGRSFSSMTLG
jgi:transposase